MKVTGANVLRWMVGGPSRHVSAASCCIAHVICVSCNPFRWIEVQLQVLPTSSYSKQVALVPQDAVL
jgi:hypothetical protein